MITHARVPTRVARFLVAFFLAATLAPAGAGAQATPGERYTEPVSGTLISFDMMPVSGGPVRVTTAEGTREVRVAPFWIGRTEVPWDLYDVFVFRLDKADTSSAAAPAVIARPSRPYVLPGETFGHQGLPALGMTHAAARQFARWLSAKTGRHYRLPTEAEWELACRMGMAQAPPLESVAWFATNAGDRTHTVGSRAADALGLSDLLGNAAEWVDGADGTPVVKGGAFADAAAAVHCGARQLQAPAWNVSDPQLPKSRWWLSDAPFVGLRLVREP